MATNQNGATLRAFLASWRMERPSHALFLLCMRVLLPCASLGCWSPHHPQVCHIWSGKSKCVSEEAERFTPFSYCSQYTRCNKHVSIYQYILILYLFSMYLYLYIHLSISITFFLLLFIYLFFYISLYLYPYLYFYLFLYLSLFLFIYLLIFISLYLSLYIHTILYLYLYLHTSISPYRFLSYYI